VNTGQVQKPAAHFTFLPHLDLELVFSLPRIPCMADNCNYKQLIRATFFRFLREKAAFSGLRFYGKYLYGL